MTGATQMETTQPIQTLTDELLGEIADEFSNHGGIASFNSDQISAAITELRTLRAENADLRKDAGRYEFCRNGDLDLLARFIDSEGKLPAGAGFDAAIDSVMEQAK